MKHNGNEPVGGETDAASEARDRLRLVADGVAVVAATAGALAAASALASDRNHVRVDGDGDGEPAVLALEAVGVAVARMRCCSVRTSVTYASLRCCPAGNGMWCSLSQLFSCEMVRDAGSKLTSSLIPPKRLPDLPPTVSADR